MSLACAQDGVLPDRSIHVNGLCEQGCVLGDVLMKWKNAERIACSKVWMLSDSFCSPHVHCMSCRFMIRGPLSLVTSHIFCRACVRDLTCWCSLYRAFTRVWGIVWLGAWGVLIDKGVVEAMCVGLWILGVVGLHSCDEYIWVKFIGTEGRRGGVVWEWYVWEVVVVFWEISAEFFEGWNDG
jgi:hypothetical protein